MIVTPPRKSNNNNDSLNTSHSIFLTPKANADSSTSTADSSLLFSTPIKDNFVAVDELKIEQSFLIQKIGILKIHFHQSMNCQDHEILNLIQYKPSWYLHTVLRCYSVPYHCHNSVSTKALGYQLPILVDVSDVHSFQSNLSDIYGNRNVYQIIEREISFIDHIQKKFSSSLDSLSISNQFTKEIDFLNNRHNWLNYIHISLNCVLDEIKFLTKFDSTEVNIIQRKNLNGYFSFKMEDFLKPSFKFNSTENR